jgi:peptidoglycan hydrolase-like protein with peptidoglycan-binding domain
VKKKIMVTPPQVVRNSIPAEYKTIEVTKVATPPRENVMDIPAVYDTVIQQEKVTTAEMKWRPILCETNTTAGIVMRIQNALDKAGYNPGNIDGVLGSDTMSALNSFQKDNGLAAGQLTMAALQKLGVL